MQNFENDHENEIGTRKRNRNKKSQLLIETASFGAKALASGFLTGMGIRLGSQFVDRMGSSKKQRVSVADLRRNG